MAYSPSFLWKCRHIIGNVGWQGIPLQFIFQGHHCFRCNLYFWSRLHFLALLYFGGLLHFLCCFHFWGSLHFWAIFILEYSSFLGLFSFLAPLSFFGPLHFLGPLHFWDCLHFRVILILGCLWSSWVIFIFVVVFFFNQLCSKSQRGLKQNFVYRVIHNE